MEVEENKLERAGKGGPVVVSLCPPTNSISRSRAGFSGKKENWRILEIYAYK